LENKNLIAIANNIVPVKEVETLGGALGGVAHGIVDFIVGSAHDLQTMMVYDLNDLFFSKS
jgi:hypothetical protein